MEIDEMEDVDQFLVNNTHTNNSINANEKQDVPAAETGIVEIMQNETSTTNQPAAM